jgi:hypothetical protein
MRRALIGAAVVGLFVGVGGVRAEVRFVQTEADAGEVRGGLPLVHRFTFTNAGPHPAEVVEMRPSCGCLRPRPDKRTYQPGESGEIALEVHTLGEEAGPHRWTLQVAFLSNGTRDETTLALAGRLVHEVGVRPGKLTIFADSAVVHELLLTDHRSQPLRVREVTSGVPWLTGRVAEERRDADGTHAVRIVLQVAASCPEGRSEQVASLWTNDATYRELRVPVTVVKRGRQRVTALPATVSLRPGVNGAVPSRIVLLEDRQNEAVVVEKVEADNPALVCNWARGPGNRATLRVTVDRNKAGEGRVEGTVRVQLAAPLGETVTVPVTCDVSK